VKYTEISLSKNDLSEKGCAQLLSRIKDQGSYAKFCGEHTGLYSLLLSEFLIKKGWFMRLENSLQIKLSTGIKRDKNDRTDCRDIALYTHLYQDRAEAGLKSLEILLSFRDRLLQNGQMLSVPSKEIRNFIVFLRLNSSMQSRNFATIWNAHPDRIALFSV
jgi:transposase